MTMDIWGEPIDIREEFANAKTSKEQQEVLRNYRGKDVIISDGNVIHIQEKASSEPTSIYKDKDESGVLTAILKKFPSVKSVIEYGVPLTSFEILLPMYLDNPKIILDHLARSSIDMWLRAHNLKDSYNKNTNKRITLNDLSGFAEQMISLLQHYRGYNQNTSNLSLVVSDINTQRDEEKFHFEGSDIKPKNLSEIITKFREEEFLLPAKTDIALQSLKQTRDLHKLTIREIIRCYHVYTIVAKLTASHLDKNRLESISEIDNKYKMELEQYKQCIQQIIRLKSYRHIFYKKPFESSLSLIINDDRDTYLRSPKVHESHSGNLWKNFLDMSELTEDSISNKLQELVTQDSAEYNILDLAKSLQNDYVANYLEKNFIKQLYFKTLKDEGIISNEADLDSLYAENVTNPSKSNIDILCEKVNQYIPEIKANLAFMNEFYQMILTNDHRSKLIPDIGDDGIVQKDIDIYKDFIKEDVKHIIKYFAEKREYQDLDTLVKDILDNPKKFQYISTRFISGIRVTLERIYKSIGSLTEEFKDYQRIFSNVNNDFLAIDMKKLYEKISSQAEKLVQYLINEVFKLKDSELIKTHIGDATNDDEISDDLVLFSSLNRTASTIDDITVEEVKQLFQSTAFILNSDVSDKLSISAIDNRKLVSTVETAISFLYQLFGSEKNFQNNLDSLIKNFDIYISILPKYMTKDFLKTNRAKILKYASSNSILTVEAAVTKLEELNSSGSIIQNLPQSREKELLDLINMTVFDATKFISDINTVLTINPDLKNFIAKNTKLVDSEYMAIYISKAAVQMHSKGFQDISDSLFEVIYTFANKLTNNNLQSSIESTLSENILTLNTVENIYNNLKNKHDYKKLPDNVVKSVANYKVLRKCTYKVYSTLANHTFLKDLTHQQIDIFIPDELLQVCLAKTGVYDLDFNIDQTSTNLAKIAQVNSISSENYESNYYFRIKSPVDNLLDLIEKPPSQVSQNLKLAGKFLTNLSFALGFFDSDLKKEVNAYERLIEQFHAKSNNILNILNMPLTISKKKQALKKLLGKTINSKLQEILYEHASISEFEAYVKNIEDSFTKFFEQAKEFSTAMDTKKECVKVLDDLFTATDTKKIREKYYDTDPILQKYTSFETKRNSRLNLNGLPDDERSLCPVELIIDRGVSLTKDPEINKLSAVLHNFKIVLSRKAETLILAQKRRNYIGDRIEGLQKLVDYVKRLQDKLANKSEDRQVINLLVIEKHVQEFYDKVMKDIYSNIKIDTILKSPEIVKIKSSLIDLKDAENDLDILKNTELY